MRLIAILVSMVFLLGPEAFAQDWAKPRLEKSPRHLEFVNVQNGKREIRCFVAYPQSKTKTGAVLIIHEIFGLADWVRTVADQFAEAGYIAIAPDLLSGMGAKGGGTDDFASGDDVRKAIVGLPAEQVNGDLNAVAAYVSKLPACNGKVAVAGFCWGGSRSFQYAAANKQLKAALVFYGTGPDKAEEVKTIVAPVYGFYGENDARVGATVPKTIEVMKAAAKRFQPVTYKGAGHGFMRAGEAPDASEADKKARSDAWVRTKAILKKSL